MTTDWNDGAAWMWGDIMPIKDAKFNVFMISNGKVATPRSSVLHGITRKVAMEVCAEHGFDVVEKDITIDELLSADELFATNR